MKVKLQKLTQTFARAIIQPVMFMAVSGLFISVAALFKIKEMPALLQTVGNGIFTVLNGAAISQLSVIFCVGIATAIAKKKKTDAAILAITTFLIFLYSNHFWLDLTHRLAKPGPSGLYGTGQNLILGIQATDMGVFLGIILGCLVGFFVNKFGGVKFKVSFLAPYEGTKFTYVLLIFTTMFFAILVSYVWPPINHLVTLSVESMSGMGALGYMFYGFLNRLMLPFGMHHLLWMPIYYTPLGGTARIAGKTVSGAMNIWLTELGNANSLTHMDPSIGYLGNMGPMFLPIGIGLALVATALPKNKARAKAIVWPAVFTAVVAGITEPIEFLFLFVSPILWFAHAVIYGFGLFLANVAGIRISVEAIITTVMYSLAIPPSVGHQIMIIPVGLAMIAIEYFVFKTLIVKLKIPTIGREDIIGVDLDTDGDVVLDNPSPTLDPSKEGSDVFDSQETPSSNQAPAPNALSTAGNFKPIVEGLGGIDNIEEINNCISRLRIDVFDPNKVDVATLKKYPAAGVIQKSHNVQIVIGVGVSDVAEDLKDYIKGLSAVAE
ncbi:PTS transporter subunit EIIC [Lacticaseibacillus daqingensis]|uniref:PTS transporter subunit EIIC n=1 Tax=Lacticaseibacillus daqingensis TaxID=2486014 RepID=UPI000F7771DA|nr:PTS transporter subunit EIIC [Lacticaseibacillus daqingensis]